MWATGITCVEHINSTVINFVIHAVVRMAERSKAPDSRLNTFLAHTGSGRSGLLMEAWVRIPLLTMFFFLLYFLESIVWIQRRCIECYGSQFGLKTCVVLSLETLGGKLLKRR